MTEEEDEKEVRVNGARQFSLYIGLPVAGFGGIGVCGGDSAASWGCCERNVKVVIHFLKLNMAAL